MHELKTKTRTMKWWINEINDKMKIYELENNKHKWKNDINDKMTVQAFNVNLWLLTLINGISWNETRTEQKLDRMHSYVLFFFMPTAFNFSSVKQNTTINAMPWEYLMLSQYHIASINLMFCAFQIYLLVKLCRNKWKLWVSLKTGFRILRQIKHFL